MVSLRDLGVVSEGRREEEDGVCMFIADGVCLFVAAGHEGPRGCQ